MKLPILAGAVLLLAAGATATAQDKVMTLSAVCKDPQGYLISYQDLSGPPQAGADGFKNSAWSFQWSTATPTTGRVITQDSQSAGGGTHAADAAVVYTDDFQALSFVAIYKTGVWFYTLYPASKVMVASRHMISPLHKGGSGAIFSAKCDMGVH